MRQQTLKPRAVDTWRREQNAADEYTVESLEWISVEDLTSVTVAEMENTANPFTRETFAPASSFERVELEDES